MTGSPLVRLLWTPRVRTIGERLPLVRRVYDGWRRQHPFDGRHGTDTSGSVSAEVCSPDLAEQISPYGGSQPSIVRRALQSLPDHGRYVFVDVGCGKGRPLLVASELPFQRITGIELSASLAGVARRNAALVASRDRHRPAIEIVVGDATSAEAPGDRVVYFLYHPFGRMLVEMFIRNLERHCGSRLRHAFVVYYNPVHGEAMDQSPQLTRWSADSWPYAAEEIGFGPDLADTVVIWQTVPEQYPARTSAQRKIAVAGQKADLRN